MPKSRKPRLSPRLAPPKAWTPVNHHGLTEDLLVQAFSSAKRGHSRFRAPQAEGATISSDIMNALGEQLDALGWHFALDQGRMSLACPEKRVQLAIASGNAFVGRPDSLNGQPLVNINNAKHWWEDHTSQLTLAGIVPAKAPPLDLWLGLYHRDRHEVRVELSHAIAVDGGYVTKWGERFGLPPIPRRFSSSEAPPPPQPRGPRPPAASALSLPASRVDGLMKPRR